METKTFIKEYLIKMREIQKYLLEYFENEETQENDFEKLIQFLDEQINRENQHELKSFLHLISKIATHHRPRCYFNKIEQILKNFANEIQKYYSNCELFNIFRSNKRLLLFLFEEKMLLPSQALKSIITNDQYKARFYPQYFYTEFKQLYTDDSIRLEESEMENFEEKRKIGENDTFVCKLIREDLLEEFITFVQRSNLPLNATVNSIFETNTFLCKNQPTLIEYAAFFGSSQIFKYLYMSGAELKSSLWLYSIHGRCPEIVYLLGEYKCQKSSQSDFDCLVESLRCHHFEITDYIQTNLFESHGEKDVTLFSKCLKFYNFVYLTDKFGNALQILDNFCNKIFEKKSSQEFDIFCVFCKYDYYSIVEFLLKTRDLNLKSTIIK